MFKAKPKNYFVSWISATEPKIGNFMVESSLKGDKLVRKLITIAHTYCPNAIVLSINTIP